LETRVGAGRGERPPGLPDRGRGFGKTTSGDQGTGRGSARSQGRDGRGHPGGWKGGADPGRGRIFTVSDGPDELKRNRGETWNRRVIGLSAGISPSGWDWKSTASGFTGSWRSSAPW